METHRRTDSEEVFGLPNIKSAKKRVLLSEVRNARNKAERSALKTTLKKFDAAVAEGNRTEAEGAYKVAVKAAVAEGNRTEAEGAYKVAVKTVDKAVAKGILHKNNAAHKKSALTLKLNGLN